MTSKLQVTLPKALGEAEELMNQFEVLYPNDALFRLALRGSGFYQLSGCDAHLWAYVEYYGLKTLLAEDFSRSRFYRNGPRRRPVPVAGAGSFF